MIEVNKIYNMKFDTPVHELYRAIQAEGSRAGRPTILLGRPVVRIGVILEKVDGAMHGNPVSTLKRQNLRFLI